MVPTTEALGIFLLAVLPGFVGLRVYGLGRPPRHAHGAFSDVGTAIAWSVATWAVLFTWEGAGGLAAALEDHAEPADRIAALAQLVAEAVAIGICLAVAVRGTGALVRSFAARVIPATPAPSQTGSVRGACLAVGTRCLRVVHDSSAPSRAWDRLLARLVNRQHAILCRVITTDGQEVFGMLADEAHADWSADGQDLLLVPEVVAEPGGRLSFLPGSKGVFVSGERIVCVSAVEFRDGELGFDPDG